MTSALKIMESHEFKKCVDFHGHICPGLSIGFRAAQIGLARLREKRSEDEEIVAIVETDACSADAVQVLTGCTFGKGNFIYKDYGKMVLTLLSRKSGEGVRITANGEYARPGKEHMALIQKVVSDDITMSERKRFQELHHHLSCKILEAPEEMLFTVTPVNITLPERAKIEPSVACSVCGEPVMTSKLENCDGKRVCRGCLDAQ